MICKWGCYGGCQTYGAHLRHKSISYNGCFPTRTVGQGGSDATRQKKWDRELDGYRDAVRQGIEPSGTTTAKTHEAVRLSDKYGVAYGTPQFKELATNIVKEKVTA